MANTPKPVTLTFDNGPHPDVTPRILDILAERGIRTTFFVLGKNIADPACRKIAETALDQGHLIGNHTYNHAGPLGLDEHADAAQREIGETQRLLGELAADARFFRPCGGGGKLNSDLFGARDRRFLIDGGFTVVLWNVVPGDWNNPDGWVERALDLMEMEEWPLVVLHDIPGACCDRLEVFLDALDRQNAELRQEFPTDCMPVFKGKVVNPDGFDELVRSGGGEGRCASV